MCVCVCECVCVHVCVCVCVCVCVSWLSNHSIGVSNGLGIGVVHLCCCVRLSKRRSRLDWAHTGIHDALSAVNSLGLLGSVPILWVVACHVAPTLPTVWPIWATWATLLTHVSAQHGSSAITMATWRHWARLLVLDSAWAAVCAPRLALHARKQQVTRNMDPAATLPPVLLSGPSPVDAVALLAAAAPVVPLAPPTTDPDATHLVGESEPQSEVISVATLHTWLATHGIASVAPAVHPLQL
jgi:hypothetical protein